MRNEEIVLTRDSARRVAASVKAYERGLGSTAPGRTACKPSAPAMVFKVTTQIDAASDQDTPGSGFGTMRDFNQTTGKFSDSLMTGIKIWNVTETPIAVGSTVQCVSMYGQWFYDVTMCSNGVTGG